VKEDIQSDQFTLHKS